MASQAGASECSLDIKVDSAPRNIRELILDDDVAVACDVDRQPKVVQHCAAAVQSARPENCEEGFKVAAERHTVEPQISFQSWLIGCASQQKASRNRRAQSCGIPQSNLVRVDAHI